MKTVLKTAINPDTGVEYQIEMPLREVVRQAILELEWPPEGLTVKRAAEKLADFLGLSDEQKTVNNISGHNLFRYSVVAPLFRNLLERQGVLEQPAGARTPYFLVEAPPLGETLFPESNELSEYLSTGVHPLKGSTENFPVNQIVSGDCLKVLPVFPDGVFDCCIADPPFNISKKKGVSWAFSSHVTMQEHWDMFAKDDYFQFTVNWITEVLRVLKPNGNLFIFGSFHCIFTIGFILQSLFDRRIISQIVWYKPNAQPNITCRMFTESTEFILWAVNNESKKAKNWTFNYDVMKAMNKGKQMRNMWEIPLTKPSERKHGKHPSQKPVAVINRLVLAGTNEGDLILDPFSGTGTTAVVAEQHNRSWIMIEKEDAYNQIARRRLDEVSNMLFEDDSKNY